MSLAIDGKPAKTTWQRGEVVFIGRGVAHESKNTGRLYFGRDSLPNAAAIDVDGASRRGALLLAAGFRGAGFPGACPALDPTAWPRAAPGDRCSFIVRAMRRR